MRHKFEKGHPKYGGQKKGTSGRALALKLLDKIFADNLDVMEAALREALRQDPIKFYDKYGIPFAPKRIAITSEDALPVRLVFAEEEKARAEEAEEQTPPEGDEEQRSPEEGKE